jgi:hypothetical protein
MLTKRRITKFVATANDGTTKDFRKYTDACAWLDEYQPETATRGFTQSTIDDRTEAVRHSTHITITDMTARFELGAAERKIKDALNCIGRAWTADKALRSNRLADATSLLERASRKVRDAIDADVKGGA